MGSFACIVCISYSLRLFNFSAWHLHFVFVRNISFSRLVLFLAFLFIKGIYSAYMCVFDLLSPFFPLKLNRDQ